MIVENNVDVIEVDLFFDFVERGMRISARKVLDIAFDLYLEVKAENNDNFWLKRTIVDESGPHTKYFKLKDTSKEFKAMAEVAARYIVRAKDIDNLRLAKYYDADATISGTDYLVGKGLIQKFDADDMAVTKFGELIDTYCENKRKELEKIGAVSKLQK